MDSEGCFLVLDVPLRGDAAVALKELGLGDFARDQEAAPDTTIRSTAGASRTIGLAHRGGRTILSGLDLTDLATGGSTSEQRMAELMRRTGASFAFVAFLQTTTVGWAFYERGSPALAHWDGVYERLAEEDDEANPDAEEFREAWSRLHPFEADFLGTEDPPCDGWGRPKKPLDLDEEEEPAEPDGESSDDEEDDDDLHFEPWEWGDEFVPWVFGRVLREPYDEYDDDPGWLEASATVYRGQGDPPDPAPGYRRRDRHAIEEKERWWWWVALIPGILWLVQRCL